MGRQKSITIDVIEYNKGNSKLNKDVQVNKENVILVEGVNHKFLPRKGHSEKFFWRKRNVHMDCVYQCQREQV